MEKNEQKKASVCVWGGVEGCSHELLKGLGERGLRQGQAAEKEGGPCSQPGHGPFRFSDIRKFLTPSRPFPVADLIRGAPHW